MTVRREIFSVTSEQTDVGPLNENLLIATYHPRVLYFALRRLRQRSLAEEVAQETLAAVLQALKENRLREPEKLAAFIFATARHLILKIQRDQARELEHTSNPASMSQEGWFADPDDALILEEERNQVRQAVDKLDVNDREVLQRVYSSDDSLEEVAKALGIDYAALRKRKSRALERLRKIMVDESQNDET